MIAITGYKQYTYPEVQSTLHKAWVDSEKTPVQIASEIDVKAALTVQNCFNPDKQIVSDEVLTNVMKSVGIKGSILWHEGERFYYISKNGK